MRNNKPSGKGSRETTPRRFGARRVMRTGVSIIKPRRDTAGYKNGCEISHRALSQSFRSHALEQADWPRLFEVPYVGSSETTIDHSFCLQLLEHWRRVSASHPRLDAETNNVSLRT